MDRPPADLDSRIYRRDILRERVRRRRSASIKAGQVEEKKSITLGACCFLGAMIFFAYVLNAWGQIRGTFNYVPPESLIELFKWLIGGIVFTGTAGLLMSGLVALRGGRTIEDKELKK